MTKLLTIGVVGTSQKENEHRVAIHPEHLGLIAEDVRKQMTFERGYGKRFGIGDDIIARMTSGKVASREEILEDYDCVLLPKPQAGDLKNFRKGGILWGWPHCVQQREITQVAIERNLTLIAWEEMFTWSDAGEKKMHTFYKNNELAGYAGVNHALSLAGISGFYGKNKKIVVISFGSVSRGAIYALQGQGYKDITVITNRPSNEVKDQIPGIVFKQMVSEENGDIMVMDGNGGWVKMIEELRKAEIIINGILQNSDSPKMFVSKEDSKKLKSNTLIIDVSCDEDMGFWCAQPTSFEEPILKVDGIIYYAVDHSPSYYWDSASWEISKALIPFLNDVVKGETGWRSNATLNNSIEIKDGVIQNEKILNFQHRSGEYPHKIKG